jgi:hypothetical protein
MDAHRVGDDVMKWCRKVNCSHDFDILLISSGGVLMRGYFSCPEGFACYTSIIFALVFEVALAVFSSLFAKGHFHSLSSFSFRGGYWQIRRAIHMEIKV